MGVTKNYNNRLEGFQGDSKNLMVVVYDSSSNLMDITDYDASLYMQKYPIRDGNPIDVSICNARKDASQGAFWFEISKTDLNIAAGDYVYEVVMDDGSTHRYTVIQDRLTLTDSIL